MMWFKAAISILLIFAGSSLYGDDFDTLRISASLDTLNKQIHGYVEYDVPGLSGFEMLKFQLFPNAYASGDTPYLSDYPQLRDRLAASENWGKMEIDSLFVGGEDYSDKIEIEDTRGTLPLNKDSGGQAVRIYFTTTVPELGDRLSYNGDEYLLDGWYPRPAVLLDDGTWYNPRYGMMAELVGDFYHHEVSFTAPSGYVIAAAVTANKVKQFEDTLSVHYYSLGPVHDFALSLSPRYEVIEKKRGDVLLKSYLREFEFPLQEKIANSVELTFDYMEKMCGPYPYPSLSVACADIGFTGGIETPGLIILSSPRGSALASRVFDLIIIHETVHEWFYGMVGTDQIEDPWLDEAVTEYFTLKIIDSKYDNVLDFWGFEIDASDQHRFVMDAVENEYHLSNPVHGFTSANEYFGVIYSRGALVLKTIDNLMGEESSTQFWKEYFETYRFGRPGTDDFVSLLSRFADAETVTLMEYFLTTPGFVDWSVSGLKNEIVGTDTISVSFTLSMTGEFEYPVDYRLYLVNGDSINATWNPVYSKERIRIETSSPVTKVLIDPDYKFTVDANLLNNSSTFSEDNKAGIRLSSGILFLIESILSYLGGV